MIRFVRSTPSLARLAAFALALTASGVASAQAQTGDWRAGAKEKLNAIVETIRPSGLPEGFAVANGRLEAEQVEIATKMPGRIAEILAREGDAVEEGAVLARMDVVDIRAQFQAAQAQQRKAEQSTDLALAQIAQRDSERKLAEQELGRVEALFAKGFSTAQLRDQRRAAKAVADAAVAAAKANHQQALSAVDAAKADVARIQSILDDAELKAPRRGRIEYRLAQPGEVLGPGARVLTLIDLTDIYMTVFAPASVAGRLQFGDEARLILDPIPSYVAPARVSFVASEAQFTPKSVETKEEREKLMFRVKLSLPPDLLRAHEKIVKTGVRGVAYLRVKSDAAWPASLAVKLPQ